MNQLKHVAIIMDGNGRWGLKKKKSRNYGHNAGLNTVEKVIKCSVKNKVKYLTLYAFSTENWKRPKKEIHFLMNLLDNFIDKKIYSFNKNRIKLKIIGNLNSFNKVTPFTLLLIPLLIVIPKVNLISIPGFFFD